MLPHRDLPNKPGPNVLWTSIANESIRSVVSFKRTLFVFENTEYYFSVVPPFDSKPCGRVIYPTGLTSDRVHLLYSRYLTGWICGFIFSPSFHETFDSTNKPETAKNTKEKTWIHFFLRVLCGSIFFSIQMYNTKIVTLQSKKLNWDADLPR